MAMRTGGVSASGVAESAAGAGAGSAGLSAAGAATGIAVLSGLFKFIGGAITNYSRQKRLREDAKEEARQILIDMDQIRKLNLRIPAMRAEALQRLRDIIGKSKTEIRNVVIGAVAKSQERLGVDFSRAIEEAGQQLTQQRLGGSEAAREMARQMLKTQVGEQKKVGEKGQEQIAQAFSQLDLQQAAKEGEIEQRFKEMEFGGELELAKLSAAQRRAQAAGDKELTVFDWLISPETGSAVGDIAGGFLQSKAQG